MGVDGGGGRQQLSDEAARCPERHEVGLRDADALLGRAFGETSARQDLVRVLGRDYPECRVHELLLHDLLLRRALVEVHDSTLYSLQRYLFTEMTNR